MNVGIEPSTHADDVDSFEAALRKLLALLRKVQIHIRILPYNNGPPRTETPLVHICHILSKMYLKLTCQNYVYRPMKTTMKPKTSEHFWHKILIAIKLKYIIFTCVFQ